ncbi:MAG: hypothetical protein ACKVVT_04185 [Dehalococcoidia bacterium]
MTPDDFFVKVCEGLGFPGSAWRVAGFKEWARLEGMPYDETFNPLATTRMGDLNLDWDRGSGPGNWNSVPVRVYRTAAAGVRATVETIANGRYPAIIRCFRDQKAYADAEPEFDVWIGPDLKYSRIILDFMIACGESKDALSSGEGEVEGGREGEGEDAVTGGGGTGAGGVVADASLLARLDDIERLLGGRQQIARLLAEGQDFWRRFEEMQTVAMAHLESHGGGTRGGPRVRPDFGDSSPAFAPPAPGRRRSRNEPAAAAAAPGALEERPASERPGPRAPRAVTPPAPSSSVATTPEPPKARRRRSPKSP